MPARRRFAALAVMAGLLALGCDTLPSGETTAAPDDPAGQAPQEGQLTPGSEDSAATDAPPSPVQVVFPTVAVTVELARTADERARGLGGHAPLGPTDGMLFVFEQAAPHAFWMKGMTFPLDIMWIEGGKVVHLERDVPPSPPSETDLTRPVYTPSVSARYVLEVNAGFAAQHGVEVGTPLEFVGLEA
ncbi:MAG TPA: DUF192 domain-containing protein [Chloroflexota bacterium]|nr:DUF192 domain-containing protein [Chloroflexota bacterium]